jgi:hypothetical protein
MMVAFPFDAFNGKLAFNVCAVIDSVLVVEDDPADHLFKIRAVHVKSTLWKKKTINVRCMVLAKSLQMKVTGIALGSAKRDLGTLSVFPISGVACPLSFSTRSSPDCSIGTNGFSSPPLFHAPYWDQGVNHAKPMLSL